MSRLYQQARAPRWSVAEASFAAALERSAAKAFADAVPDAPRLERYLAGLHLADLALACACADGNGAAWDHFVLEYRPVLYRAADAIEPGGGGREHADAIYADLFGLQEQRGERRSLFRYFHGRSSLATWLRAVLSQRHVDRIRSDRKLTPLDESGPVLPSLVSRPATDPDAARYVALVRVALLHCLAAVPDRERLRLALYYRDNLTLAEIGRLLSEHEATVSRQLARTRKAVRTAVEQHLQDKEGLSRAEIANCFEVTIDDPGPLDLRELLSPDARKDPDPERSR